MHKSHKITGVRANVAPWCLLVVDKERLKRPSKTSKRFAYVFIGQSGNRAARRVIPLLTATTNGFTCDWLQSLPKGVKGIMRYRQDGQAIRRAVDLIRDESEKQNTAPGLHGATERQPMLVATVRGKCIRLDLHLGKDDTESTDFEPPGLAEALQDAARICPTDKLTGYAAALRKTSDGSQNGHGNSGLTDCFRLALEHACKTFDLCPIYGPSWNGGLVELGPFDAPTAHPLQRVFYAPYKTSPPLVISDKQRPC